MSEIKQNITNELSEEELENVAGGFGRPTMDDPRYREQMRINNMLKRGMNMEDCFSKSISRVLCTSSSVNTPSCHAERIEIST